MPNSRRRLLAAVIGVVLISVSLVTVTITGPRVSVQWHENVTSADRVALEQHHNLRDGKLEGEFVWRYILADWSRDAVASLVNDPAVADTHYIDRSSYQVDDPSIVISTRIPSVLRALPFPFSTDNRFESLWFFFHVQSFCLIMVGCALLRVARIGDERSRRAAAFVAIVTLAVLANALPLEPSLLRMGDANTFIKSRSNFETYHVDDVRFEAHLSHALLGRIYPFFGPGEDAPERAFTALMRAATAWFIVCALATAVIERWSPQVIRYIALVTLAPASLLYFGFRELAYLSLNVAAFPLLAHGIHQGSKRLESGAALAGLGAALHGFGLLSIVGAWMASLVARASWRRRLDRLLRIAAWGTAAYVGWVAIYVIAFHLPISLGHADNLAWRPLFVDDTSYGSRRNVAIFSSAGIRDIVVQGWVVGAPVLLVVFSLWKRHRDEVLVALCYSIPSVLYSVLFWPMQGLGVETDTVFAAFPAIYAGAWVCAKEQRPTRVAAALLILGHIGFWRMVLDTRFVNWAVY